ncbi:MAG: hypothetical protein M1817_002917 [Caeruleum heppii]|nr:MAG: hypothetical protein M1817_002917 [Caeruleum heppii]
MGLKSHAMSLLGLLAVAGAMPMNTTGDASMDMTCGSNSNAMAAGEAAAVRDGSSSQAASASQGSSNMTANSTIGGMGSSMGGASTGGAGQGSSAAGMSGNASGNAKAVYLMSNNFDNKIVCFTVNEDGTLSMGSETATGGEGANMISAMTGAELIPDGLVSQSALAIAGNKLVAVNARSNTLSMFNIAEDDPTQLTMVGQPVNTMGDFPNTVAASSTLNIACVGNTGAAAGVACFEMSEEGLVAMDEALRPFDIGQTNPPTGPPNTVSHALFNADSTMLLTTVKGDPMANKTGFLAAFPVVDGKVSMEGQQSSPEGTAVLFGSVNVPGGSSILATDASFGAATLEISADGQASVSAMTAIEGQNATCWATFSMATMTAFVTDVNRNTLVEIDPATGELVRNLDAANGNPGMIDLANAGNFIYALSPGSEDVATAIAVFDVSGGRGTATPIQNLQPGGAAGRNSMSMQVLR